LPATTAPPALGVEFHHVKGTEGRQHGVVSSRPTHGWQGGGDGFADGLELPYSSQRSRIGLHEGSVGGREFSVDIGTGEVVEGFGSGAHGSIL
jgi:hypothetical protein